MAEKTIELSFKGYFLQNEDEDTLLNSSEYNYSGIYVVYVGTPIDKLLNDMKPPIYIGESENISERLTKNHNHYEDWKKELKQGEKLYFSIAYIDGDDRKRAEAALIFEIKPKINEKGKNSFDYPKTTIKSSGDAKGGIPKEFTVPRYT